ncbi:toxin-antitoxin system, toxin component [Pasteurellaceae bacterium 15-036681]|nr:toxin-antitoxin system, toxin component [Pasteurellaceae bacterium 15-036681]
MEKRIPHYSLEQIKNLIVDRKVRTTKTALFDAHSLGLDFDDMLNVINRLTRADFYKSMTTYTNHQIWQDVYRPYTEFGSLYVKLTVIDDLLIVSFKEL